MATSPRFSRPVVRHLSTVVLSSLAALCLPLSLSPLTTAPLSPSMASRASGRIDNSNLVQRGSGRLEQPLAYRGSGRFDSQGSGHSQLAYRGSGRFSQGLDLAYRGSERGIQNVAIDYPESM